MTGRQQNSLVLLSSRPYLSSRHNKKLRYTAFAMQRIFSFYVFTLCRPADNCAERIYDDKDECRHKDEQHL